MQSVFHCSTKEFMDQEVTSLTVKGHGEIVTFHLRVPFTSEDAEYAQRFTQIADKKGEAKANAEYQIYVDTLAGWSARKPERSVEDDEGNTVKADLDGDTPAEAVRAYFEPRTASKDWIAVTTVSAFRNSLFPAVVFHEHSA